MSLIYIRYIICGTEKHHIYVRLSLKFSSQPTSFLACDSGYVKLSPVNGGHLHTGQFRKPLFQKILDRVEPQIIVRSVWHHEVSAAIANPQQREHTYEDTYVM